jgi:predicted nucleic acid-binding protein
MERLKLPEGGRLVFADTSALFALASPRDQNNAVAKELFGLIADLRCPLLSTNHVVAEYHALLVKRVGSRYANEALAAMDAGAIEILIVNESDERAGRSILAMSPASGYTLADAIAFGVMNRLGIRYAYTFDEHFAMQGFDVPVPMSR